MGKDPSIGANDQRPERDGDGKAFLPRGFKKRRCIIPADGFYEWQRTRSKKQPYFFRMREEDRPFGFAGIWERWKDEDGGVVESCSILTTEANELLHPVHDRMPVILHPEDYQLWLDEDVRKQELRRELLRPFPSGEMVSYPVSTLINSPRNQGAELIEEMQVNSL